MIFWIFFLILSLIVEVYLWWKLQASLIFLSGRTCTIGGWLNTFLPHCSSNRMSSWSDGNAANTIGVFIKCGDKILGRNGGLGHNETLLKSALQRKHGALTVNAWSSLTSFAVVIAKINAVLNDSHLMSDSKIGSNGGWHRELRTIIKSHVGLRTDHRRQ